LRIEISGTGWEEEGIARKLVAETLTSVDEKGQVQPKLALRWEAQNGGRRWLFWLRPYVKFHDGTLLTPSVVAQALSASSCKECPWRSARAAGDAVIFDSDAPMPLLPAQLALTRFAVTRTGDNANVIGTGPFRVEQVNGGTTTLQAFDEYWQAASYLNTIEINGGKKPREQALDFSVGRADVIEVAADQLRRAQQDRVKVISGRDTELIALVVDNNGGLQDSRLRQAVSEAIDRNSLLNVIFQRQGEITGTLLPNWLTGYGPLFPAAQNLDHARELRGQWLAPIPPVTVGYDPGDTTSQLLAERIALNIREIGLSVQAVARRPGARSDMYLTRTRLSCLEPSVALESIAAATNAEPGTPDDTTLEAVFRRERAVLSDYRVIPLLYMPSGYAIGDRVHELRLSVLGEPILTEAWTEVPR
jgi:peptide/nickel transport system substrate-binding protein